MLRRLLIMTTVILQQVYPPTVAARSIAVHGCMISIGLSTGGTVICLDKRMLGGGAFEAKVAATDTSSLCGPTLPSQVRQAAKALTACVNPYPALPNWVQSKCCSDVIFAGTLPSIIALPEGAVCCLVLSCKPISYHVVVLKGAVCLPSILLSSTV